MIPHRSRDWHPAVLLLGCGFSIALFASWLLEPTRSLWLALDERVFWALNDSLAWGRAWQVFWAAAGNRMADVVAALCMVGLFAHFVLRKGRDKTDFYVAAGLMLTGLVFVGGVIALAINLERPSPTIVHPDALRLSVLVPWLSPKDASYDSFPGDHAMVILLCAGVLSFYLPRAHAVAAWVVAGAFVAPRLMSGAHWLTDDLVGSVAIVGLVLSGVFATPLHRVTTDALEQLIRRIRRLRPTLFDRRLP